MAFKRSAVRSRLSPPQREETLRNQGFFFFLPETRSLDFSLNFEDSRGAKNEQDPNENRQHRVGNL